MSRVRPCRCVELCMTVPAASAAPITFTRASASGFRSTCDAYVLTRDRPPSGGPSRAWEWVVRRSADSRTILAQGCVGECPRSRHCGTGPPSRWSMAAAPVSKAMVPAVFLLRVTAPGLEASSGIYGALDGCRLRFAKLHVSEVGAILRGEVGASHSAAQLDYVVSFLPETGQFELCARHAGGGCTALYGLAVHFKGPAASEACALWGHDPHPSAPQHDGASMTLNTRRDAPSTHSRSARSVHRHPSTMPDRHLSLAPAVARHAGP